MKMDLRVFILIFNVKHFDVLFYSFSLACLLLPTYGYDSMDPSGNITIKWDIMQANGGTEDQRWHELVNHKPSWGIEVNQVHGVRVSIINYQLFRHIEYPGWKLSWAWPGDEVIWNIDGAEATEQGNCSAFRGGPLPHCCEKEPVIIDLLPGTPYNKQVANCCKGGVVSSMTQDPGKYISAFQMSIGSSDSNGSGPGIPVNFTLGLHGYTCGEPFQVPPTKFTEDQGRRRTQALATWNVTCSYSQFRASVAPTCCVSFSAFYNNTIIPCQGCSCACQTGAKCVKPGDLPPVLQLQHNETPEPAVQCSDHMCPIRVHWHVMQSYTEYWRVKITVTNLNYVKNYSQWNLVVLHPNLQSVARVFSFNYKPLNQYGNINDTGVFYGIQHYNDMLLQAGVNGNVQTEMLLHKEPGVFSFREGWAFPRKISFNGEQCVLPSPQDYPRLPNAAESCAPAASCIILSLLLLLVTVML